MAARKRAARSANPPTPRKKAKNPPTTRKKATKSATAGTKHRARKKKKAAKQPTTTQQQTQTQKRKERTALAKEPKAKDVARVPQGAKRLDADGVERRAAEAAIDFLETNGCVPGAVDLIVCGPASHEAVVVALAVVLLTATGQDGKLALQQVEVLLPSDVDSRIAERVRAGIRADLVATVFPRFKITSCASRSASAAAAHAAPTPARSALLVAHADLFSSPAERPREMGTPTQSITGEEVRHHLVEDAIVLELRGLAAALLAARASAYTLCISGFGGLGSAGATVLESFGAVTTIGPLPSESDALRSLDEWVAALRRGDAVGSVRRAIVASGLDDAEAGQVLCIALSQVGRPAEAFKVFRSVLPDGGSRSDPAFLAMGARLAIDAAQPAEAAALVTRVLDDTSATARALLAAVQAARHAQDPDLLFRGAALLHKRTPDDVFAAELLAHSLKRRSRRDEVATLLEPFRCRLSEDGKYLLAYVEQDAIGADLEGVLGAVPATMRERAIADRIFDAASRRDWLSVDAAVKRSQSRDDFSGETARAISGAVRGWVLDDIKERSFSQAEPWARHLVELASHRPGDVRSRHAVEALVDPEVLGETHVLALAVAVAREPSDASSAAPQERLDAGEVTDSRAFMAHCKNQRGQRELVMLVPQHLGVEFDDATAARLIRGGVFCLQSIALNLKESGDVRVMHVSLAQLLDVIHTANDVRTARGAALAVAVVHYVATSFALIGWHQHARDCVESALLIAGGCPDPGPHADAWLALADVRLRGNQTVLGAVALALASRTLPTDATRRARFCAYSVRTFRMLGLFEEAEHHLSALRIIFASNPDACSEDEVRGLGWSLILLRADAASRRGPLSPESVARLCDVVTEAYGSSSDDEHRHNRMVAGSTLANAVRLLREGGHDLSISDELLLKRLEDVGADALPSTRWMFGRPSLKHLSDALNGISARYGADVVHDARAARVIARRLVEDPDLDHATRAAAMTIASDLEVDFSATEVSANSFGQAATEQLFERGREGVDMRGLLPLLPTPAPVGVVAARALVLDPQALLTRLRACAAGNVEIEVTALLGWKLGRLQVTSSGVTWIVESADVFDGRELAAYEAKFPFDYHSMKDGTNPHGDVAATLRKLRVSTRFDGADLRVVVPDHRLLAVPANLTLIDGDFVGDLVPVAQVPSLSWLLNAREGPSPTLSSSSAWILREADDAIMATLTVGANELQDRLETQGVKVHRGVNLQDIVATDVTWLVAHGRLGLDGRHFGRVADDRGTRHAPEVLVSACASAAIVVLLVCSGGRMGDDAFGERVRGLPALLLRNGVRAVVASPWPLDVLVGARWSQSFAEQLFAGVPVASAAHRANNEVGKRYHHPRDRLAMHVYGDPWLTVSSPLVST